MLKKEASIYSQKDLKHLWNRVLFAKHSEKTLHLGKAISDELMFKNLLSLFSDNPY